MNSRKAVRSHNGDVTIHFGGSPETDNFRPIMPGWNYMLRIYIPEASYFDGTWVPAKAVQSD